MFERDRECKMGTTIEVFNRFGKRKLMEEENRKKNTLFHERLVKSR